MLGVELYNHKDIFFNKENEFQWQGITAISAFFAFVASLWSNYKTRELNRKTIKGNYLYNNRLKIIGDIQSDFAQYVLTSNEIIKKKETMQENNNEIIQINKIITEINSFEYEYRDRQDEIIHEGYESNYINEYGDETLGYSPEVTAGEVINVNRDDYNIKHNELNILKKGLETFDSEVKELLKNLRGIKIQLSLKLIKDEEIVVLKKLEKHCVFISAENNCEMQLIELEALIETFKKFFKKEWDFAESIT
ncbi:hypothetical protein ACJYYY_02155 [Brochothrix campestris]